MLPKSFTRCHYLIMIDPKGFYAVFQEKKMYFCKLVCIDYSHRKPIGSYRVAKVI